MRKILVSDTGKKLKQDAVKAERAKNKGKQLEALSKGELLALVKALLSERELG